MENVNLKSIVQRLKSETPLFWVKIRKLMISVGAIGIALLAAKTQYTLSWLPEKYVEYMIVIGTVGTALASLTSTSQANNVPPPPNAN